MPCPCCRAPPPCPSVRLSKRLPLYDAAVCLHGVDSAASQHSAACRLAPQRALLAWWLRALCCSPTLRPFHSLPFTSSLPPHPLPAGGEAVTSPFGGGSGALSPSSGILSPTTAVHEKRIPLNKLFENLQDLAASRTDTRSPGLEAAMAAVAGGTPLPPNLPPLPHPAGGRPLPPSNSGSVLEASAGDDHSGALFRPRSEACLVSLPRLTPFNAPHCAPASAPSGGNTLAAAADAVSPSSSSAVSPRISGAGDGYVPLLHTTSVPLPLSAVAAAAAAAADGMPSMPSASPALYRSSAHALSAPPSKLPSRDVSPARGASLSPTRPVVATAAQQQAQLLAAAGGDAAAAYFNGKRPPVKGALGLRTGDGRVGFFSAPACGMCCDAAPAASLGARAAMLPRKRCSTVLLSHPDSQFPCSLLSLPLQTRRRCAGRLPTQ